MLKTQARLFSIAVDGSKSKVRNRRENMNILKLKENLAFQFDDIPDVIESARKRIYNNCITPQKRASTFNVWLMYQLKSPLTSKPSMSVS